MKYGTFKDAFLFALEIHDSKDRDQFMMDFISEEEMFKEWPKYQRFLTNFGSRNEGLAIKPMNRFHDRPPIDMHELASPSNYKNAEYWVLLNDGSFLFDCEDDGDMSFKEFILECIQESIHEETELKIVIDREKLTNNEL